MELVPLLENIGLNEKEAKVYLALLQLGKSTAYAISVKSGLKKPTTYVILQQLIEKGAVSKIPRAKTMQYRAVSPEVLFSEAEARIDVAQKAVLPELKALSRAEEQDVKVSYCEGLDGIKEIYKKILVKARGTESVAFYGHQENVPDSLRHFWRELNPEFKKYGVGRRVIIPEHPSVEYYLTDEEMKKNAVIVKKLPLQKYNSNISVEIYLGYTFIFSHRYLQGTLINNRDVAGVMRQIFEIVWETSEL